MEHVAVLVGSSAEREVSLMTAKGIIAALKERGYEVTQLEIDRDLAENLLKLNVDVVFIAAHGKYGEDGTVQGLLEILDIPYVGSGILASSLAMNKIMSKKIFAHEGLRTPEWIALYKDEGYEHKRAEIEALLAAKGRLIIKPSSQGSTIGLSQVKEAKELDEAIAKAFQFDREVLIEEAITGTELTVPVLGNRNPLVLPCVEIVPLNELYDYEAKYVPNMSRHFVPPLVEARVVREASALAERAHLALGCLGISRADFIADEKGDCWLLEVNTLPGMTNTSLVPESAKAYGYSYADLVEKLIDLALEK